MQKAAFRGRHDYDHQKSISMERVDMATALALRRGLDPGKIVRTWEGSTLENGGIPKKTLDAVKSVVTMSDYMHIKRMLTSGCPYELKRAEETKNVLPGTLSRSQKVLTRKKGIVIIFLCANGCATWDLTCDTQLRSW